MMTIYEILIQGAGVYQRTNSESRATRRRLAAAKPGGIEIIASGGISLYSCIELRNIMQLYGVSPLSSACHLAV
jgi:hypothetical protein